MLKLCKPNIQSSTGIFTLKIQECTGKSSRFNSIDPIEDKEIELWAELNRLFEPDVDDELWKSQKHVHDITWRLYDTCEVHHMLAAKLLVEQNNEMSKELLRKIFMMAERPRSLNTTYCLLLDMAYWILFPSWSLVSAGTDTPYLP
ncbi:hypothetical protein Tco_0955478 [Tanacetum coccineum]|uniref:Uncharacterized protein n=1 Tax=Tanacetum coccineum TaxID=301880 RepID=A0ABQ5E7G7_9ASTR